MLFFNQNNQNDRQNSNANMRDLVRKVIVYTLECTLIVALFNFFAKIGSVKLNPFLENLKNKKKISFYDERQKYTNIETLGKIKKLVTKIDKNDSAEIFRFKDFNIVEFNTKANALDYKSMDALIKATDKPLIIMN